MSLPYFSSAFNSGSSMDPIYKSLYECLFLNINGETSIAHVENMAANNNILELNIQDMSDIGYKEITRSKLLIVKQFNIKGDLIKIEIFTVKISNLSFDLSWSKINELSLIKVFFEIIDIESIHVGSEYQHLDLSTKLKAYLRDFKIDSVLR